jgi:aerobic carbon-monoxide dehydrogenase large subunit
VPTKVATRKGTTASIGRSEWRKEDPPLLRGQAGFVDDLHDADALHAAILRSPIGHARLGRIDATPARDMDGVIDVITAADLPEGGPKIPMRMFKREGMERFLQRPLATDKVRYSGEPVAVVVAESRYLAEDATELIEVDYEPLPTALDLPTALAAEAPLLHEEAGSNLVAEYDLGRGDVEEALAAAEEVVEITFHCGRHAAVPMETRGLLAFPEKGTDRLVLHGAAKIVHVNRRILAAMLGWPEERIRFVEPHVGGGFGARGEFYPEDFLIPFCALRLGRAVAWTEDREEHLRSTNHSRDQVDRIRIGLDSDGRFLALDAELTIDTGAYVRTHGGVVPGMSGGLLPGPYVWPSFRCKVRQVVTNKTPSGTYRAPGRYETTLARERAVDIAARQIGLDPVELRRRNLIPTEKMPYDNGSLTDGHPVVYDSGDYLLLLEQGLELFGDEEMRRWREEPAAESRRRGVGLAFLVEKSGIAEWEYARIEVGDDGRPVVFSGSASIGQGVETVLAQVAAETLGLPYESVTVRHGDTDEVPDGMGAFGSRATSLGGAAVAEAATALRERLLGLAGEDLGLDPAELDLAPSGVIAFEGGVEGISYARLRELAGAPLTEETIFRTDAMSFPYGVHHCAVEIDTETGEVRIERYAVVYDVGRAINPQLIEGQIRGGLAQGLGGALFEELAYDENGTLVSGSFMDYLIPTANEVPAVRVRVTEEAPTPRTPLGAKGAGEGGTTAAGAAIAAAVSDALGVEVMETPIRPEWVVRAAQREAS